MPEGKISIQNLGREINIDDRNNEYDLHNTLYFLELITTIAIVGFMVSAILSDFFYPPKKLKRGLKIGKSQDELFAMQYLHLFGFKLIQITDTLGYFDFDYDIYEAACGQNRNKLYVCPNKRSATARWMKKMSANSSY